MTLYHVYEDHTETSIGRSLKFGPKEPEKSNGLKSGSVSIPTCVSLKDKN